MAALTVSSYGCYVNPGADSGCRGVPLNGLTIPNWQGLYCQLTVRRSNLCRMSALRSGCRDRLATTETVAATIWVRSRGLRNLEKDSAATEPPGPRSRASIEMS